MRSTHNSNEFSCSLSCPCSQTKQNLKPKAMFSRLPRVFIASATSYVLVCKEYPNRSACQSSNSNPMDCPVPACADKADMFRKSIQGISGKKSSHEQNHTVDEFGILLKRYSGCPLDRSELGQSSWDLLHTMAANYPEKPTKEQQTKMKNLIESLSEFYPCIHCAIEFQKSIKASPPRVESRGDLVKWFCEQHNEVNEMLGKPTFPCNLDALDERWRISQRQKCSVEMTTESSVNRPGGLQLPQEKAEVVAITDASKQTTEDVHNMK